MAEVEVKECKKSVNHAGAGAAGGVFGLGFIGALVFFIQHSDSFWMGVLGVLKAIVWPAILVYKLLELVFA